MGEMVLTVTTGVIDAVSYVGLGHVFTARMTGNVVFIGFALSGAEGVSVARSLVALTSFACGALVGGRVANGLARAPVRHLAIASGSCGRRSPRRAVAVRAATRGTTPAGEPCLGSGRT